METNKPSRVLRVFFSFSENLHCCIIGVHYIAFIGDLSCEISYRVHCKQFPIGRLPLNEPNTTNNSNKNPHFVIVIFFGSLFSLLFLFSIQWKRHLSHYRWPCHHFFVTDCRKLLARIKYSTTSNWMRLRNQSHL